MSLVLLQALQNASLFPHKVDAFELIETHISWVLLTGPYAYKIKKPMNFGFLDFSTLKKRYHYCLEELRLNRRFAPEIYLELVAISGDENNPKLGGEETPFEYAVKMRQFPQEQLLDSLLTKDRLTKSHINRTAEVIADFHSQADTTSAHSSFGEPDRLIKPVRENFAQIHEFLKEAPDIEDLKQIEQWADNTASQLEAIFKARKQSGMIRECHGDLHLGNVTLLQGKVTLFDCIEFSETLRWIDVISEAAFFCMDLEARGKTAFANLFLNTYLERTGDYKGLQLLRFYKSYRAMVRSKVALLKLHKKELSAKDRRDVFDQYHRYTSLAKSYMIRPEPKLILMHGFSGTGKSTVSAKLLEKLGAIRLRSDIERKRLFNAEATPPTGINKGMYSHSASDQTFAHLVKTAKTILQADHSAIIDASFLHKGYRDQFQQLAESLEIPIQIVSCELDDAEIRKRLEQRQRVGTDPSEADISVYESQRANAEPLTKEELDYTRFVNTISELEITLFLENYQ